MSGVGGASPEPRDTAPFVLDLAENPHPRMLREALAARAMSVRSEQDADYWRGYLDAMCAATGETPEAMDGWLDSKETLVLYLSGSTTDMPPNVGVMAQPGNATWRVAVERGLPWAADNGCFGKGQAFDANKWLNWLSSLPREGCLFAVAPDVVGDAAGTLVRSRAYLTIIRGLGFKAAYAAQNGSGEHPPPWDDFDVLFVGGDTEWKLGREAAGLVQEAKRRGKWVHMGRVNSWKRLRYATQIGCDSADGTYLAFGPKANAPRLAAWVAQRPLGEAL